MKIQHQIHPEHWQDIITGHIWRHLLYLRVVHVTDESKVQETWDSVIQALQAHQEGITLNNEVKSDNPENRTG
jgi:hypothetical protein